MLIKSLQPTQVQNHIQFNSVPLILLEALFNFFIVSRYFTFIFFTKSKRISALQMDRCVVVSKFIQDLKTRRTHQQKASNYFSGPSFKYVKCV